ncbi:hypothetical protein OIV83_000482 [Microbotryomycetes sp. JL201]|nr:hypothetical protein OIV83_000482 [Microbotryomycetes sp. JL201]
MVSSAFEHVFARKKIVAETEARKSFIYNEAFSVLKAFFEKGTLHTVEEAQKFGNTFVPSPSWVRVIRVVIPPSTLADAAKVLIDTIGEKEVNEVIGGKEWWQRTAHPEGGIDGEWISMKKDWPGPEDDDPAVEEIHHMKLDALREALNEKKSRRQESAKGKDHDLPEPPQEAYAEEMDSMRCILYIHGGAHFFGSINTHRYQIWRYARKIGGRAFAVKYRLSPQYPFPCSLQDSLAAYLYLIRPPPGAKHKSVDPSKLVVAGDSAGGGLSLSLLLLLRDSGLPMPAGLVLISPWVDLTHSFPSILKNTATDIIPPYGFLFKPSTLWPPPPTEFQEKAKQSTTIDGLKKAAKEVEEKGVRPRKSLLSLKRNNRKGHELAHAVEQLPDDNPQAAEGQQREQGQPQNKADPAKQIKIKIDGEEVELVDQIQLYATNDQASLVHPFVSPLWAPSLGGLPPTYILAGEKEVLHDEIVYLAHRMAHPDRYPLRKELLEANPQRTQVQANLPPTLTHLQVYDGVCHDLPLLSFTTPAKYCFRAVASFIKFVTTDPAEGGPPSPVSPTMMRLPVEKDPNHEDARIHARDMAMKDGTAPAGDPSPKPGSSSLLEVPKSGCGSTVSFETGPIMTTSNDSRVNGPSSESFPTSRPMASRSSTVNSSTSKKMTNLEKTIYSSTQPFHRPDYVDNMIRERISLTGVVRALEPESELECLNLNPEDIGVVKEAPVKRYLAGKTIWDKKFKSVAEKVQREREDNLRKSMREEASRITERIKKARKHNEHPHVLDNHPSTSHEQVVASPDPMDSPEQHVRGIWDLHGENPPPSSIAARKDTREARALARTLDEHYNKLHALNVWSEFADVSATLGRKTTRNGSSSNQDSAKGVADNK